MPMPSNVSIPGATRSPRLRITSAAQAAARDRAAIAAGIPSFTLMLNAGTCAASLILRDYSQCLRDGVLVVAGPGNNGGDAYIVAAQLARSGVRGWLCALGVPRSDDARRAAALFKSAPGAFVRVEGIDGGEYAMPAGSNVESCTGAGLNFAQAVPGLVVDGVLGTGHHGELRESVKPALALLRDLRLSGSPVVSLDLPSGLDASNGAAARGAITADCTVCFGTIKRGVLLQRAHAGRIVLADIGLAQFGDKPGSDDDDAWMWKNKQQVASMLPAVEWNAHKGTRGRVMIAGGASGMAGAIVLSTRTAVLAGAGLVYGMVDATGRTVLQNACPQVIAQTWPEPDGHPLSHARETHSKIKADDIRVDALALGPGLGRSQRSAIVLQHLLLSHNNAALLLDADALWHAANEARVQGTNAADVVSLWTRNRSSVVLTPHAGEFATLLGKPVPDNIEGRAQCLSNFARRSGATVLLKGTPTLIASPGEPQLSVVPHGTAMLATGGSGDCLTGLIATLLAQGVAAHDSAVAGASVHGYCAELVSELNDGEVRGTTLSDFHRAMPRVWRELQLAERMRTPGVLADLPSLARRDLTLRKSAESEAPHHPSTHE